MDTSIKKPKSSQIFLKYALSFILGIFVAWAANEIMNLSGSDEFAGWNQEECTGMPGNTRDGLRIGTDAAQTDAEHQQVLNLIGNYVGRYRTLGTNPIPNVGTASPEGTSTEATPNAATFPTITKGGNISRCVLLAILKSLKEEDRYVNYALGLEGDKTILFLQGGRRQPISGLEMPQPLLYRTGTELDCFCPNQCGIQ